MPSTFHQDRAHRMNAWHRATNAALTPEDALRLIQLHLDEQLPQTALTRRAINTLHDGVIASLDQGFAVGAELTVRIERDGVPVPNLEGTQQALSYQVSALISWSGTGRTVAEATASLALYQILITAAALIEAHFRRVRIARIEDCEIGPVQP